MFTHAHIISRMKAIRSNLIGSLCVSLAPMSAPIIAVGTSCRSQISDGTGRRGSHVARILELALE